MNVIKHKFTLEMTMLDSQVTVRIKKNDTKNKLIISLVENGKPYDITESLHAKFVGKKPDGTIVYKDCDIVGNTIEYTITEQTSIVVGIVACEIRLFDANDNLLTSPRFTVVVDETVYNSGDIETGSKNEIDILDSLIAKAADIKDKFEQATKWKVVEPNSEHSYRIGNGNLYRVYGDYASTDIEPLLRFYITVNTGENIQTYVVDEVTNLGFAENKGCVTVQIIRGDVISDIGVRANYLLNGEIHAPEVTVFNPYGEPLLISDVYAVLLCEDMGSTTVYETGKGIFLTDSATMQTYELYIADGKMVLEESEIDEQQSLITILNSEDKEELNGKIDNYVNGSFTMPSPVVGILAVTGPAVFERNITIPEPILSNNPVTKKYVDDMFAEIKLAEEGAY